MIITLICGVGIGGGVVYFVKRFCDDSGEDFTSENDYHVNKFLAKLNKGQLMEMRHVLNWQTPTSWHEVLGVELSSDYFTLCDVIGASDLKMYMKQINLHILAKS